MLDWIKENKDWLFSGVAIAILVPVIGHFWPGGKEPPYVTNDNSVQQTHSGTGDNVVRDKIIHKHLYGSVDYQKLIKKIQKAEELLAGIAQDQRALRLKQSAKVEELKQRLEEFKEADAVLKTKDVQQNIERLQKERETANEKLTAIEQDLEKKTQEFHFKIQPASVTSVNKADFKQVFNYYSIIFRRSDGEILKWQEPRASRMMTWDEANEYVEESNLNWLMNHNNWRLPAIGELRELAKFIKDSPESYSDIDKLYWSSEDIGAVEAKVVNLGNAKMEWSDVDEQVAMRSKRNRFSVRLVRTVPLETTSKP